MVQLNSNNDIEHYAWLQHTSGFLFRLLFPWCHYCRLCVCLSCWSCRTRFIQGIVYKLNNTKKLIKPQAKTKIYSRGQPQTSPLHWHKSVIKFTVCDLVGSLRGCKFPDVACSQTPAFGYAINPVSIPANNIVNNK